MIVKHFIVYKTTNIITQEYYIGVHGQVQDDEYLGSGIHLKRQVKFYGKENFIRETLKIFDTEEEAFDYEKELLRIHLDMKLCLNISPGGDGGPNFKNMTHSDETKEIIRESARNRKVTEETKEKLSKANLELSQEFRSKRAQKAGLNRRNVINGKMTEEEKKKISETLIKRNKERIKSGETKHTFQTKKKMSDSAREFWDKKASEEFKENFSKIMKATWTDKRKSDWGETQKKKWTPEMRRKASEKHKSQIPWNKKLECGHIYNDKCNCVL